MSVKPFETVTNDFDLYVCETLVVKIRTDIGVVFTHEDRSSSVHALTSIIEISTIECDLVGLRVVVFLPTYVTQHE